MLFIHPMWDTETQRIGLLKCSKIAYNIRGYGEMIGCIGLISVLAGVLLWIIKVIFPSLGNVGPKVIGFAFVLGVISEVMVQLGWYLARRKNFNYDYEKVESSWTEDGVMKIHK